MARVNGTVKFFNHARGFGFIQPDDGGNDVFVHISAVERAGMGSLNEGQKLSFESKLDSQRGKTRAERRAGPQRGRQGLLRNRGRSPRPRQAGRQRSARLTSVRQTD